MNRIQLKILSLFFLVTSLFAQGEFEWTDVAPMLTPRWGHAAVAYRDLIYVFGGVAERNRIINSVEIYNIEENRWERGPSLPYELYYHSAVVYDHDIYIFGGKTSHMRQPADIVLIFDPNRGEYRRISVMPEARYGTSAVLAGEFILVMGGRDERQRPLASGHWYNPSNNTWIKADTLTTPRSNFGMVINESSIYAVGGINFGPVALVERIVNRRWNGIARMRTPRGHIGVASLGDTIMVAGGISNNRQPYAIVEGLRQRRGEWVWVRIPDMNTPRADFALIRQNRKLYAIGGHSTHHMGMDILRTVEMYSYVLDVHAVDPVELPESCSVIYAWPNPTNSLVSISLPLDAIQLQITNINGNILEKKALDFNNKNIVWDSNSYPAGTYFYIIRSSHGIPEYINRITVVK